MIVIESAIVTYKDTMITSSTGSAVEVEFLFFEIKKFINNQRNFDAGYLHFYHVHPKGFLQYSNKDFKVVKSLYKSLAICPLFSIICYKNSEAENIDHDIVTYQYQPTPENMNVIDPQYVEYKIDDMLLYLMKGLSFASRKFRNREN